MIPLLSRPELKFSTLRRQFPSLSRKQQLCAAPSTTIQTPPPALDKMSSLKLTSKIAQLTNVTPLIQKRRLCPKFMHNIYTYCNVICDYRLGPASPFPKCLHAEIATTPKRVPSAKVRSMSHVSTVQAGCVNRKVIDGIQKPLPVYKFCILYFAIKLNLQFVSRCLFLGLLRIQLLFS